MPPAGNIIRLKKGAFFIIKASHAFFYKHEDFSSYEARKLRLSACGTASQNLNSFPGALIIKKTSATLSFN